MGRTWAGRGRHTAAWRWEEWGQGVRVMNTSQRICSWQPMWLHCSSLTCQPRSRMPVVALSQHVAELAALPIPQQPFFLQRTLISDVTALFERSFYTNPSTTKKTKSPPWWKKGVSPLPDGTGFWLGSARWAFYCCYWSLSGLPNFLKLYLLAPGRNLGA